MTDEGPMDVEGDDWDNDGCCFNCGGDGFVVGECFEDSCCCANPELDHDLSPCPYCTVKAGQP